MAVVDVAVAASVLGTTKSAIRKAIARGTLRATLVPGRRRGAEYEIAVEDLDAYVAAHRRKGAGS